MRYLLLLILFSLYFLTTYSQQWTGTSNLTGNLYRSGRVGIGNTNPLGNLSVSSKYYDTAAGNFSEITLDNNGSGNFYGSSIRNIYTQSNPHALNPRLTFLVQNAGTYQYKDLVERMTILGNGNIGIGLANPGQKLHVNGITLTNKLYVGNITDTNKVTGYLLAVAGSSIFEKISVKTPVSWPDYVFNSSYQLMSLREIDQFIRENKHLPNFPSALEVKNSEGVDLGDINLRLIEKVEELTLHLIELQKKYEQLGSEFRELKENKK